MKQNKKYLFVLFFFITTKINAQLNEFMVQSYVEQIEYQIPTEDGFSIINTNAPWLNNGAYDANNCYNFLMTLKGYNFNSVYFVYDFGKTDVNSEQANLAQLNSIITVNSLFSWRKCIKDGSHYDYANAWSALQKYSNNNVLGYCIVDEPFVNDPDVNLQRDSNGNLVLDTVCGGFEPVNNNTIDIIPDYTNIIKEYNNSLLRYANLCCIFSQFPSDDYYRNNYLQKYIDESKPNLLSFDQYPIESSSSKQINFFKTLYDISLKSVENSIPYIYVLTPFEYIDQQYENSTLPLTPQDDSILAKPISKFNYVIYSSLIYNAKGISYWPGFQWVRNTRPYIFKLKYSEDKLDSLSDLHYKLILHSNELLNLNFASVYHKSKISTIGSPDNEQIHPFCEWNNFARDRFANAIFSNLLYPVVENGQVPSELAISFMTNSSGQIYYWLFNKSLSRSMSLSLNAKSIPYDVLNEISVSNKLIQLEPGEAKLLRTNTIMPDCNITANNTTWPYNSQNLTDFSPLEIANNINISNTTFNGATKSFMGNKIKLSTGTKILNGSIMRFKAYKDCNTINNSTTVSNAPLNKGESETSEEKINNCLIKLYPNPIKQGSSVNLYTQENKTINIQIIDLTGKTILNQQLSGEGVHLLPTSNLVCGTYLIILDDAEKNTIKLIIK